MIDQAEGAIALARVVQAAGARRVALELERLQRIRGELDDLGRETEKTRS